MTSKGLTALLLAALLTVPALAQGGEEPPSPAIEESEGFFTFNVVPEGIPFDSFVQMAAIATGKTFVYDSRRLGQAKVINMVGTKKVPKEDLFDFLQVLFYAHDMAVVSIGTPETEVLLIEDIKTSQALKQRAVFVDFRELEVRRSRVGEIIATTIPLQHIPVDKAQRALNNIIQEHRAGFVQPIEESNSLLVTNFAPTVWTMYQIIQAMDVPVAEEQLEFEKISLEYHIAEELGPIIESLIEVRSDIASSGGGAARPAAGGNNRTAARRSGGSGPPAPRIIPDARTGSLLVYATPEFMAEIKMLVASLDSEVTEPNSNIHIYELKNTNAEDIQDVLTQLLQDGSRRSARPSGTGGRGRTAGATAGGSGNSSDPDFVNIVADPNTNSLLITATRQRFDEIAEIVERLDQRRPQVLVQAAIAELSDNDLENIGVELLDAAGTMSGVFGASSFGLSTIDTRANVTGGDTGDGGDGTGGGGGTGGGTTSSGDEFFNDLVRIPNLDASGFTGGVFRNFLEVPVLVQLFKQVVKGNLVSVPSILVNDNQEARIVVGSEIPTTAVNQGQFSDQTSFQGYQEASLEMVISPTISNDNYLRLEISVSIQAFTGSQSDPSIPPPRTTRELTTNITLQSGRTVVIGGLTTDNYNETITGIPLLMDIPILGYLFRSSSTNRARTTLYVFITPTIINEFEALERISYERKLEIAKLDGQIEMVDPNFRKLELDDEELDISEIESTGHLDVLHYRPTSPLQDPSELRTPKGDRVPVKPPTVPPADATPAGDGSSSRLIAPDRGTLDSGGSTSWGRGLQTGDVPGRRRPGARPTPVNGGL